MTDLDADLFRNLRDRALDKTSTAIFVTSQQADYIAWTFAHGISPKSFLEIRSDIDAGRATFYGKPLRVG